MHNKHFSVLKSFQTRQKDGCLFDSNGICPLPVLLTLMLKARANTQTSPEVPGPVPTSNTFYSRTSTNWQSGMIPENVTSSPCCSALETTFWWRNWTAGTIFRVTGSGRIPGEKLRTHVTWEGVCTSPTSLARTCRTLEIRSFENAVSHTHTHVDSAMKGGSWLQNDRPTAKEKVSSCEV